MSRHWLIPIVTAAFALTGCVVDSAIGTPTLDVEAAQARAAEIDTQPMTRTGVHALLGEPWLANEPFGVEVYRLRGKQRNLAWILLVPMPAPSDKLEAYSLVTYGADGQVTARASDYAQAAFGDPATLILRAGDFEFVHGFEDTLSVTLDRYLTVRAAPSAGPTCTVLVGCDSTRLVGADTPGFCACGANLAVDGGERRSLSLLRPAVVPYSRGMPEADCRKAGGSYQALGNTGVGSCLFTFRPLYPLTLPVGSHELRFASARSDAGVTSTPSCRPDEVTFATLFGRFMVCTRLDQERPIVDRATDASVSISQQSPTTGDEVRVIVYDDGTWLYPP